MPLLGGRTSRLLPLLLLACEVSLDSKEDDSYRGGGDDSCVVLQDGAWTLTGDAWLDSPTGTLSFDADTCTFTLGGWDEDSDLPDRGHVDNMTLAFSGSEAWANCLGDVESSVTVTGTCDGDYWTLHTEG